MSEHEAVEDHDSSPDKMQATENTEFSSQELWDIAAKTAALASEHSCDVNTVPKLQIDSIPETPPPLQSEETLVEGTPDSPQSLSRTILCTKEGCNIPTITESVDSPMDSTFVESTLSSEPALLSSTSQTDPPENTMDVEYVCPVRDETGRQGFDFSTSNVFQLTGAWTDFKHYPDNFLRGCKWAPDGTCIMVNSNDGHLRLFNLPEIFYEKSGQNWDAIPEMRSVLKIYDGDLVYDYCWYPLMSSLDSATSCFVSTSRHSPIHMFDAYTGELRCSYRAFNQMDELESAYCLGFSCDGRKLFSGFDKTIRIFDVNIPGRECETRKTKAHQQTGIISCIAINPDMTGVYAAGSYLKTVALYSESDGSMICLLKGQLGGVTHLMFSQDGTKLFTGGRKDPEIVCWDLRKPGEVLYVMQREVTTNQRIYFDIESTGQYLASGSVKGEVHVWNTWSELGETAENEQVLQPKTSFVAQEDCINGVSFHPTLPILATASGQRKFAEPVHSEDSESDDETSIFTDRYIVRDNSLKLWWCGS